MKAVIVETKNKMAAALSADGQFINIKNRNYAIGQVIELEKKHGFKMSRLFIRVAAAAAVMAICSISAFAYFTPYSYVSLDVNPSFEYTINYFEMVLSVRSLNGYTILDETELNKLNNKNIQQAVAETLEQIKKAGYFDNGKENGILIAVLGKNEEKTDRLAQSLQKIVKTETENSKNIEIETSGVKKEIVEEAKSLGVSAGKLNLVEKLEVSAEDNKIDRNEWLQKPVKEIMDAIKENKKEEKIKDSKKEEKENSKPEDKAQDKNGGTSQKNTSNNDNPKKR